MKPENSELTYPSVRAAGANDHILGGFKKKQKGVLRALRPDF